MMNVNIRKLKQRFFYVILLILIIAGLTISYFQYQTIRDEEKNMLALQHAHIHSSYSLMLDTLKEDLLTDSKILLGSQELRKAIYRQDRKKTFELALPAFEHLQNNNPFLKVMTFRLQDGTTFLRMHKPDMHSDTLHPSRTIIIDTNQKQIPHAGFEVGKLEMAYRAITPIFYKDRFIGTLEIGVSPDYLMQALQQVGYLQYGLIVKGLEDSAALDKTKLSKIGDYYLVKSDPLFTEEVALIDLEDHQPRLMCCGKLYAIETDLDLLNHNDDVVAKILLGFDIDFIQTRTDELVTKSILFISMIIIVVGALMHLGLNFFIIELENTQYKLHQLNETLEEKVKTQVQRNREQEQHMLQQSRLAQMGELLSMIAHQWRQPLASINAIITTTKLKYTLNDFDLENKNEQEELMAYTQKQLDRIENSVVNLSHTIDDFRDFYKPSKEKLEVFIHEPVDKALVLIRSALKSNLITCQTDYADAPKVPMHLNEVTQVVLNLIQNAMEELLEHKVKDPVIHLKTSFDQENSYIEVYDNGPGIDKQTASKIFDPYFSTKENKNGSGLGLYMSRMIIQEHHKGNLYLKKESEMTCFVISFEHALKA